MHVRAEAKLDGRVKKRGSGGSEAQLTDETTDHNERPEGAFQYILTLLHVIFLRMCRCSCLVPHFGPLLRLG